MPPILGKRKRRNQILASDSDAESRPDQGASQRLQDLLQQHFEAKFKPLEGSDHHVHKQQHVRAQPPEDDAQSDWTGISEGDGKEPAQVVHYDTAENSSIDVPKEELKIFMVLVKISTSLLPS